MSDPKENLNKENLYHLLRKVVIPEFRLSDLASDERPKAIVLEIHATAAH